MKAADIPDVAFLEAVERFNRGQYTPADEPTTEAWEFWAGRPKWATVAEMSHVLNAPWRVTLAKARKLIRRGLMEGCTCGCRGDFNVAGTPISWGPDRDLLDDAIRRVEALG